MKNCYHCAHNEKNSKLVSDNKLAISYCCRAGNQHKLRKFITQYDSRTEPLKNLVELDCFQSRVAIEIIDNIIDKIDLMTFILKRKHEQKTTKSS